MSDLCVTRGMGTTGCRIPSLFGSVGRRRRIPGRSRTIRWVCSCRSRGLLPRSAGRRVRGLRVSPRHTASTLFSYSPQPPQGQAQLLGHRLTVPPSEPSHIQHPAATAPVGCVAVLVVIWAVGCGLEDHSEDETHTDERREQRESIRSDPQHESDHHSGDHSDGERHHGRWGVLAGHPHVDLHLRVSSMSHDRAMSRRSHAHYLDARIGAGRSEVRVGVVWSIRPVNVGGGGYDRKRMSVRSSSTNPRRRPVASSVGAGRNHE